MSNTLLKYAAEELAGPIRTIVNKSISLGIYPDDWKISRVMPLFKSGTKTNPSNYRPISLTPVISKVLEKVIKRQLFAHLDMQKILPMNQFGFRNKSGTNHLLYSLKNHKKPGSRQPL